MDPGGEQPIAWRTYRECLQRAAGGEYTVVLQDDARVCPRFPEAVRAALGAAEGAPAALFVPRTALQGRKAFWQAQKEGRSWCALDWREWVPVVALAWPNELIPGFLEWADTRGYGPQKWRADDAIVGEWARQTKTRVLATVPCLVEHPDAEPSITQPRRRGKPPRTALAFAEDGATGIDWSLR